jgi:hypothetical protein
MKTEDTATSGWLQARGLFGLGFSPKTRHFAEWRVFLWVKRIMTVTVHSVIGSAAANSISRIPSRYACRRFSTEAESSSFSLIQYSGI